MATAPQEKDLKDLPHFINSRKQRIFCKYWPQKPEKATDDKPKALVFIAHGVSEHCLWYDNVAAPLTEQGILVFSHDHVGHGHSEGDRVHIARFEDYVDDVMEHVHIMQEKYPQVPVFLLGHSMGGVIAILTAMRHPDLFAGVILDAPAIKLHPERVTLVKVCGTKMMAYLAPQMQLPGTVISPTQISRDEAIVKRYVEDPLNWHGGLKARWTASMLQAIKHIQSRMAEIQWPFLLLHGDHDDICDVEGARIFMKETKSEDKSFNEYKGFYHQLHHEPVEDGERVRRDIVNWLSQRL